MEKVTINQQFANIKAFLEEHDAPIGYVTFIEDRMAQVTRKNAARSNKPTKTQVANANLADEIYNAMEDAKSYTVADVKALVPELEDANPQKVTALLTKLRKEIRVSREVVKGKAYFTKI